MKLAPAEFEFVFVFFFSLQKQGVRGRWAGGGKRRRTRTNRALAELVKRASDETQHQTGLPHARIAQQNHLHLARGSVSGHLNELLNINGGEGRARRWSRGGENERAVSGCWRKDINSEEAPRGSSGAG